MKKNKEIKNLGIFPGQLYVQSITDNSANIISPAPNYYTGAVEVTFTLAKKSSNLSDTGTINYKIVQEFLKNSL